MVLRFVSSLTRLCIGSLYLESCILCPPLYRIYHKLVEEHLVCDSTDGPRVRRIPFRLTRERCLQILDYSLPLCRQFIYIYILLVVSGGIVFVLLKVENLKQWFSTCGCKPLGLSSSPFTGVT